MASRSSTKLLRVLKTGDAGFEAGFRELHERRIARVVQIDKEVRRTIERVREGGDKDLLACVRKLDGAKIETLEVTRDEWDAACDDVDGGDRAALGKAAMRIREFHRKRIPSSWEMREEGGGFLGHRVRPLARVGVYAKGGERSQPSSIIMNAVPASAVEVPEIVMATPPRRDGSVAPEILMAARVAGVHRVFKMGGAHAIAALAYGTEKVPAVDKIVGTGGDAVAAAKYLVSGSVGVHGDEGPNEVCFVADRSATPSWLAADIVAQVERAAVDDLPVITLVTHTKPLVTRIQDQVTRQLKSIDNAKLAKKALTAGGAVIVTRSRGESIEIANRCAPEHLVLAVEDPEGALKLVQDAGAVFLGHYTPVAAGQYLAGPNHVLPTGGKARFASPLGVDDFLKRMSFIKFEPPKLRELGSEVIRLAALEGLTGHGTAVDLRLQKIRRVRREREAAREAELEM